MTDSTIISSIFNNRSSMQYLVENQDLITNIKALSNYSNTLVPKILASTVYTDGQKYNYGLPFFLYNKGKYDSSVFHLATYSSTNYLSIPYFNFQDKGTYLSLETILYPNGCSHVRAGSDIPILLDKYSKLKINITVFSNFFDSNMSIYFGCFTDLTSSEGAVVNNVQSLGINTLNFSITGKYIPSIHFHPCDSCLTSDGNYDTRSLMINFDQWWIE